MMEALARWKKAVVHIETAADSVSMETLHRQMTEAFDLLRAGRITSEELHRRVQRQFRDIRTTGTAIFFKHENLHYLLTARHVLHDPYGAKHRVESLANQGWNDPSLFESGAFDCIANAVFRVPSFDDVPLKEQRPVCLMNLGAGSSNMHPYTFSSRELDLAIVVLDGPHTHPRGFQDRLREFGHVPITLEDISDGPSAEGVEVFTVGFPGATAHVYQLKNPAANPWASAVASLPTFAFGRVSMLHEKLNYFWCDLSIYPGNSGGPIIENNKLVGIVSAQPMLVEPLRDPDGNPVTSGVGPDGKPLPVGIVPLRIPFGGSIKAQHIKSLLQTQLEKDRAVARLLGRKPL